VLSTQLVRPTRPPNAHAVALAPLGDKNDPARRIAVIVNGNAKSVTR